ncbi:DNA topoisomerase I [Klebsiella pneumoniae subsp. pneumoniae]|uniref:DNA topoisomerase I n=1 Tax=Klebsiella pneumoniae subsp. pneumoniae TaxID=72407 RepID=A0A377ZW53_KLEPN|nr:DNA topoisomerase I [Klebsiella pneumoniae subsp. pneumoniae]
MNVLAETLKDMEADAQKLYQLIWRQFVACQMTPAQYDSTTLTVAAGDFKLKARGRTLRFDGWTKVMPALRKGDEDRTLPLVKQGDRLSLVELTPAQHFTKPPARFSEASLVKELEKRGIGRPSTYASIISTIQDRGYVRVENRRFYAEKMGEIVTDRLEENFRDLMNYDFTAQMEDRLDQVANHQAEWKEVLNHFFGDFTTQLATAEKDPEEGGMQPNPMVLTSIDCPTCGRKMGIRTASTGVFLGCSGYALPPKERCKTTINLVPENEVLNVLEGDDAETNALRAKRRCQKCGTAMDSYLIDPKRKLHVCGNNPTCDGYEIEEGEFRIKGYDGPVVECEKCGSEMHLKMGRFGKYMACTNDECKNTRKILRNGEVAPPKEDPVPLPELPCEKSDAYFVLRDGAAASSWRPTPSRNHGKRVRRWWRSCTASAIVCRKNCVISPMRRSRIRKAIKRWYALAVKPSSSTWRPKKRAKRPAGQLSLSTVSGRKPKSNGVRSGRKSALFLLRRPAERMHFSAVSSSPLCVNFLPL